MTYVDMISPGLWALGLGSAAVLAGVGALKRRKTRRATESAARTATESSRLLRRAALVALMTVVVVPAIGVVPAGTRGVVYSVSGGVATGERGEGVTLLIPWVQHLSIMSVRTQKIFSDAVYAQSLDLQEITVVASINFHVGPSRAAELYRDVGPDYGSTIVQPAMFQAVKTAVGQVEAETFAANRAALAFSVKAALQKQLGPYGVTIENVNIEDAIFDPNFIASVKAKVIADQVAEEQRRLVAAEKAKKLQAITQAEGRAQSVLIEARAQSEANTLLARSLTPDVIIWRLLQTWDGVLPTTLVTGDTDGPGVGILLGGLQKQ